MPCVFPQWERGPDNILSEFGKGRDMNKKDEEVEIDLLELLQALLHRAWAIILVAVITAGLALGYTALFIQPLYKSNALMYVNNSDISVGDAKLSISQGDLTAAQSLVDTYAIILKTRTTLDDVIERAGLTCTYEELTKMIDAGSVNGTQIFSITVTSTSAQEAEKIANTIAQILPEKIAAIVEGSSARIVDYAVIPSKKASPSLTKNAVLGGLVGAVLACSVVIVKTLSDDKIHDEEYLRQNYDIPVLAVIPDLQGNPKGRSGYESSYASAMKGGNSNG